MSKTPSGHSSICYHEVMRDHLKSILHDGLRLSSDGEKDTSVITKGNEFLDSHRTPNYKEACVSRSSAVYGYLAADNRVVSITTGDVVPITDAISDENHALLKLTIDPTKCYVSDLDRYDEIKEKIENDNIEEATRLARPYWDSLIRFDTYKHGAIARPELIITYNIQPDDIIDIIKQS